MRSRTSAADLGRDAVEALGDAARAVGLAVAGAGAGARDGSDLELHLPGHRPLRLDVKAMAIPSADRLRELAKRTRGDAVTVLVADQISSTIRSALNDAGISWLDRRGHLRLVGPGVYIDADLPSLARRGSRPRARESIAGRSGLAAAVGLLLRPGDPMGVSDIARAAGLNPSSIARAMASLASAHLATRSERGRYRALVPELFWALADVWPREHATFHWIPTPEDEDRLGIGRDLGGTGWAAAGVRGSVAWGAPLVVTADFPTELYVPDEQVLRRMKALHAGGTGPEVALAVDPVGMIARNRYEVSSLGWPVAHPLFCALDLTVSSRDREALEQWTPPEDFARVW